ncbi:MAG: antitoxin VapB family protein [Candidatus Hodarchaeota archaeon]
MKQKTISLSEDAYNRLKSAKKDDESFSEFILRVFGPAEPENILSFAGALKDDDEWDKIQENIYNSRESATPREIKFD